MTGAVDPVTVSVLWSNFVSVCEEMGTSLRATAFSDAVREGEDYSTAVFDRAGRLIAQGNFTPGHLGSMPFVIDHVLAHCPPRTLKPGDAILLNDSALGSGHFPDLFLVSPAFQDDELIGYVCTCAQHVDIGGIAPGGQQVPGVTEAYQEGLRIQPVRMFRESAIEPDLERILLGNVRMPDRVRGDLYAQKNANDLGVSRLARTWRAYPPPVYDQVVDRIIDRGEQIVRDRISAIPDGSYEFTDHFDDHGPGTDPIIVHVTVTVDGSDIVLSFAGSSPAVPAALNCYLNYTRAYAMFAVRVFTDPSMPQTAGAFRPVTVTAPPGSFFNPAFPAPSGGRATCQVRIFEAINGALAKAVPDKAMAAMSHWSNPTLGGTGLDGRPFVLYDLIFGGYGARDGLDGQEGLSPVLNARNIPVEVHEANNPVRVERLELLPDSGGPGRYRGGCGLRKDVRVLVGPTTLTNLGDRHRFRPYGLAGGRPGALASTSVVTGEQARPIGSKAVERLEAGDVVSFRLAGGGGHGDPLDRDPAAVAEDVLDGLVTSAAAVRDYGVHVEAGGRIDQRTTEAARDRRRRETS